MVGYVQLFMCAENLSPEDMIPELLEQVNSLLLSGKNIIYIATIRIHNLLPVPQLLSVSTRSGLCMGAITSDR